MVSSHPEGTATQTEHHSFDSEQYSHLHTDTKATIDLPDEIFERTKIAAAQRRTTIKNRVNEGLESVLSRNENPGPTPEALARLRQGYHLGGKPLTRDEIHDR